RQRVEYNDDSSGSDSEAEKPQVVVLKPGDLTADEAEKEKQKLQKEEAEKPADLTQRVIFKSSKGKSSSSTETKDTKSSKVKAQASKLSFADEEDEEEAED
uniref:DUF4604 domain-containing protein n=2 Tax=Lutzomyia longipalpis TaxID=7200 RepID=A0A1B0CPZ2_LUTLO